MASCTTPTRRTPAGLTASGACTSGSTERHSVATRLATGGGATTSTTVPDARGGTRHRPHAECASPHGPVAASLCPVPITAPPPRHLPSGRRRDLRCRRRVALLPGALQALVGDPYRSTGMALPLVGHANAPRSLAVSTGGPTWPSFPGRRALSIDAKTSAEAAKPVLSSRGVGNRTRGEGEPPLKPRGGLEVGGAGPAAW